MSASQTSHEDIQSDIKPEVKYCVFLCRMKDENSMHQYFYLVLGIWEAKVGYQYKFHRLKKQTAEIRLCYLFLSIIHSNKDFCNRRLFK